MAVDFSDPTTWENGLSESDALNLGIWALNTLAHPDASTQEQFDAADHFQEQAVELLDRLRERLEAQAKVLSGDWWVVEYIYNTDPEGAEVPEEDWSNRTVHGPFPGKAMADYWEQGQPEDTDVKEVLTYPLNDPADRPPSY